MKKISIFLFLLMAFALGVWAQNAHWEYQFFSSGNPVAPTSAVTVANSSGKIYLFQTDPNGIYVSLLDPFGNTYNGDLRLDLPDTGFYIIKAEDNSGNVVVKKIICTY